ncbi:MAG TPA: adenylosuccinate lyase [Candidatus Eremiobacteraceae bacterium]
MADARENSVPVTSSYASPFSWRYARPAMRELFSEETKRRMWRRLWLALARAQSKAGLVTHAEIDDLRRHVDAVDIDAAHKIEAEIGHDLMAEVQVYASQAVVGGGKIHMGATSMDIEDNVETVRMRQGLSLLAGGVRELLALFADRIDEFADLPCMAYTHLQAAEPSTLGMRMSMWAQDLSFDFQDLLRLAERLPSKGLRGAVGTAASYEALLAGSGVTPEQIEREVLEEFGLIATAVSGQTYPRKLDYTVLSSLAGLAASCSKFAFDIRILASSPFGELGEPFGKKQVGSSAMPFKRNPVLCERICSLARLISANAQTAWQNAADNLLERTLDDSANRRTILPESFLAADEIVQSCLKVLRGLRVDERRIAHNLAAFGPFAGTEAVLMAAAKRGGDRQLLHQALRDASMQAYDEIAQGHGNPLQSLLSKDAQVGRYVNPEELASLMDPRAHTGSASRRARAFAKVLRELEKV